MRVLGINAVYHDPSAALVIDGVVVAAAEEERFSRRKHGKRPVPFSAWELPELSAAWCLDHAGLRPEQLDAVTYSFDPRLSEPAESLGIRDDPWDSLRVQYAAQAPGFISSAFPGVDPGMVSFVPHHVAHAASAGLAGPNPDTAVLVFDGRGEVASHLAGTFHRGALQVLAQQRLPHSLGLMYESVTEHLGFLRSSDEFKVMAMASYGTPRFVDELRTCIHATGDGGFRAFPVDWSIFAPRLGRGGAWDERHADLAASAQCVLEEVVVACADQLQKSTGQRSLAMAGGVALNCVANSRVLEQTNFEHIWVQPAAGDSGTALGSALYAAHAGGDDIEALAGADLGRSWSDVELEASLIAASVDFYRPRDIAVEVAQCLASDGVVAWFQGRSEFGPRALGHRSLLAHPGRAGNLHRLNEVKGREQFRPVAPMVLEDWAHRIFSRGPIPSRYMLFVHDVEDEWRERIPAVVHVDGTARIQTISATDEPLVAAMLQHFLRLTGIPLVVNTSLNTAGRPMVDDPRDALECFGSAPIDLLAIGPFALRRAIPTRRAA